MFDINGIAPDDLARRQPACWVVFEYWRDRAEKAGGIPRLSDIDLMDIWEYASRICIKDVELDSTTNSVRSKWRYAGTMIRELTGLELTGKYLDEVFQDTRDSDQSLMELVRSGQPHYWERSIQNTAADWDPIPYQRLMMPLKGSTGEIRHTLSVIEWPESYLEDAGTDLHSIDRYNCRPARQGVLVSGSDAA